MSVSRPSAVAIAAAAALGLPLVGVPMTPLSPALAAAADDTTPPSIPVETFDGVESDITDTSIIVRWGASTDNVGGSGMDHYIVNYEDQFFNVPATAATNYSYKLTGLGPESDYDVFVYAVDKAGNTSLFLYLAYTTRAAGSTPVPTPTASPAPTATPKPTA
ncbi:MAG: fibronectin type III domain-containing protein, partial [Solirubrobacteraceae bacterium]|nr:fibronectin type III domain-containing protein [Solirubrobacteraceae bacterium]